MAMETKELLSKVRKIEIKTRGLSRRIFAGEYHSAFKGRGMSFSEVREYQYGDDVRNIDWNVTARSGHPHVKVFEEERELTMLLLVDTSQSVFFGASGQTKHELIAELCAVLAFSAANNNDKVGLLLFSDRIEGYLPPQKGRNHILRIIQTLVNVRPTGRATNLKLALEYFLQLVKRRSICFLLSDFWGHDYEQPLHIAARRHDLIALHVHDSLEASLPNIGLVCMRDAETGQQVWVDTADVATRNAFYHRFEQHRQYCRHFFPRQGADYLAVRTGEDYALALHQFFLKRM
jgi:uncharacterized protein (DUF58 family)